MKTKPGVPFSIWYWCAIGLLMWAFIILPWTVR
jgi:hypothetical protein